jgi:hypothetical protein
MKPDINYPLSKKNFNNPVRQCGQQIIKQSPNWPVDRTIFLIRQPKKAGKVAMSNGSHAKRTQALCMSPFY